MNININIIDPRGEVRAEPIILTQTIGSKKKELNMPNAFWKYEGEVLKDELTFDYYGIENNDMIGTSTFHRGGININNLIIF